MANSAPLLIITGTPRSSTTRMAAYCSFLGNSVAGKWDGRNDDRGLEDPALSTFFIDAIAGDDLGGYQHLIENYQSRVLKFPHFVTCGNTDAINAWHTHRPNLKILLMIRNPCQVYHSLARSGMNVPREGFGKFSKDLDSSLTHFISFLDEKSIPYHKLVHADFMDTPEEVITILGESFADLQLTPNIEIMRSRGATGDNPRTIWDSWFDKTAVTHYKCHEKKE